MHTNYNYRLGYIDAKAAISIANKQPTTGNMNMLFKVKGAEYKAGFLKGLKAYAKKEGQV